MAYPLPDKPSIAVLPFTNMSDDAEQEYFVDGMTEDLITDLSNISGLFVIARNSVFTYKGKPVKVKQVAEELGVRYVLEGSVRRAGDQIRINAQLIDATSGGHVWAKRYDSSIQDVFALQDQVSAQIVSALATNLTTQESARIAQVQTNVPQAYDLLLRGMQHYVKATPDHYADALKFFQQAIELDPEFSHAHAALASVYFNSFRQQFFIELGLEAFEAWNNAEEHLQQAMNAPSSLAFQVASGISLTGRNHEEAIEYAEKATALEPNDANAHATLAFGLIMAAHHEQAMDSVNLARRLDPHNEYYYRFLQGLSEFGQENYQEAMTSFEHSLKLNPELWSSSDWGCAPSPIAPLLSAYHYLGKLEAINKLLRDTKYVCSTNTAMLSWPFKESQDHDRLSNGLLGAGIPVLQPLYYPAG
jgi:TolB-like protein